MADRDPHHDLVARATAAIERMDERAERHQAAFERQADSHERMIRRMDERDAEAREHREQARLEHERMMRRMERSENLFIEAIGDLDATIIANGERINQRLDQIGVEFRDIGQSIRAHTEGLLSIIDRLGPAPG